MLRRIGIWVLPQSVTEEYHQTILINILITHSALLDLVQKRKNKQNPNYIAMIDPLHLNLASPSCPN